MLFLHELSVFGCSDFLRGAASRRSPVSFSVSSAEAFVLQHLLPLSFPLQSALQLFHATAPPLASLAQAVLKGVSPPQCREGHPPVVETAQLTKVEEEADDGVRPSPVSSRGGPAVAETSAWEGQAIRARGSTDPEEWQHFLAFASALLESSIPGGLFQQPMDSPPRALQQLQQQQQRETLLCRLWLHAVEAEILRGPSVCGGWGCLLHCAAAPRTATVARHFDFAAARAWGVKADPSLDGSGTADFSQMLQRAYAPQGKRRQQTPPQFESKPTAAAANAPESFPGQHRDEGRDNTGTEQQGHPQQEGEGAVDSLLQGCCLCRLCGLSSLQVQRILCLLDPRSISAFACTSKTHWAVAQPAVSGLESLGSYWIHSPGAGSSCVERPGVGDEHLMNTSSNVASDATMGGRGGTETKPSNKTGGLFRHQVHALLWLRHRERRFAPQQPPANIRLSWRLLGSGASAQKTAEEGTAAERVFKLLKKGDSSSSPVSSFSTQGSRDCPSEAAWPRQRQNDCRAADDLLKGLSTWIEVPLPRSSWLAEGHLRARAGSSSGPADPGLEKTAGGDLRVGEQLGLRLLQGQGNCLRVFADGHPQMLCNSSPAAPDSLAGAAGADDDDEPLLLHAIEAAKTPGNFSLYLSFDLKTALLGYAGGSLESAKDAEQGGLEGLDGECVGGMFCDDPGLGKTLSLLSLAVVSRCRAHQPPRHLWPPPPVSPAVPSSSAVKVSPRPVSECLLTRGTRMRTRQSRLLEAKQLQPSEDA